MSEDHKNEGFLKSIWHNLTNHPAHQKQPSDKDGEGKSTSKSEGNQKKTEDEKKKKKEE